MIVTGTNSVSFAKRQAYFLKENWDWTCHLSGKQLAFLTFETRLSKKDPVLESNVKNQDLFWSKTSKIGACSGFLKVKNRPQSVAHTRTPDIRKFLPPPGYAPLVVSKLYTKLQQLSLSKTAILEPIPHDDISVNRVHEIHKSRLQIIRSDNLAKQITYVLSPDHPEWSWKLFLWVLVFSCTIGGGWNPSLPHLFYCLSTHNSWTLCGCPRQLLICRREVEKCNFCKQRIPSFSSFLWTGKKSF